MKEGDVIVAPLLQSNGVVKTRPAVVLRELPKFRDPLVCGISSKLQQEVKGFDELIGPADPDFASSNLNSQSLIRLGHLMALPRAKVAGVIGRIAPARHKLLLQRLSDYLIP
jgi:mRNA interferase MazF